MLATTLLVTTLLTVMLAASFLLVSAEQRITDNSFGTAQALAIAQAGLQNYFSQFRGLDTSSTYDSTRIPETGGYADVVGFRIRPAGPSAGTMLALWVIRSSGVATVSTQAGQTSGARTIAQYAQLQPGKLPARAAMVTLNGLRTTGPPGQPYPISGHDLNQNLCAGDPGGAAADTFAINVPRGGLIDSGGGSISPPTYQYGIPMVDSMPFPLPSNLYDTTHIDWAGLLAGNFTPDYTIPPGPWPAVGGTTYSVGYVTGDVQLPAGQRRGMLVVAGDVTAVLGTHWDGIIIAGGNFTTSPSSLTNFDIHGMLVTGLNVALGQSVPMNQAQRGRDVAGDPPIQWAWCYAQSATNALASLVPIKGSWADTWSTY